jgi:hypothetical protein
LTGLPQPNVDVNQAAATTQQSKHRPGVIRRDFTIEFKLLADDTSFKKNFSVVIAPPRQAIAFVKNSNESNLRNR